MAQGWLTQAQQQEYELIDRAATSACIQAEQQCHKFKMGNVPRTPDLTKAINRVLYWKGVILRATGHRVGTSVLRTRAKKGGMSHNLTTLHLLIEGLQNELKKAYCHYHTLKMTHRVAIHGLGN